MYFSKEGRALLGFVLRYIHYKYQNEKKSTANRLCSIVLLVFSSLSSCSPLRCRVLQPIVMSSCSPPRCWVLQPIVVFSTMSQCSHSSSPPRHRALHPCRWAVCMVISVVVGVPFCSGLVSPRHGIPNPFTGQ